MITISKLNVEWSNKYHPKHNESRNKAVYAAALTTSLMKAERDYKLLGTEL
jgi:hypothetical protein